MDREQEEKYGAQIAEWKETVKKFGTGWDEDAAGETASDYLIRVGMHAYVLEGVFYVPDPVRTYIFANPRTDIFVKIRSNKAHTNRLIRCAEFARSGIDALEGVDSTLEARTPIDCWLALEQGVMRLAGIHDGETAEITMHAMSGQPTYGYATQVRSTQEVDLSVGAQLHRGGVVRYYLRVKTPVHTVCPFMLHEADGHSHTQRAYLQCEIYSDTAPVISPIMREINTRLQPCQAAMKIPDETIHVLRAYSGPLYTEDGAIRLAKILRGTKDEFLPKGGPAQIYIKVHSMESIFPNDLISEVEDYLE